MINHQNYTLHYQEYIHTLSKIDWILKQDNVKNDTFLGLFLDYQFLDYYVQSRNDDILLTAGESVASVEE